ncbi:MAG: hypothetical protein AB7U73_01205 [Pirellulales bacterium]
MNRALLLLLAVALLSGCKPHDATVRIFDGETEVYYPTLEAALGDHHRQLRTAQQCRCDPSYIQRLNTSNEAVIDAVKGIAAKTADATDLAQLSAQVAAMETQLAGDETTILDAHKALTEQLGELASRINELERVNQLRTRVTCPDCLPRRAPIQIEPLPTPVEAPEPTKPATKKPQPKPRDTRCPKCGLVE